MRLWHQKLIPQLPRQQLLGQHRECCALRGKGWGKPHSVINYVFKYSPSALFHYHMLIVKEMQRRGYTAEPTWLYAYYRGKNCSVHSCDSLHAGALPVTTNGMIYPEHDDIYLLACIRNLCDKGVVLEVQC